MKKILLFSLLSIILIFHLRSQNCVFCNQTSYGFNASMIGSNCWAHGNHSIAMGHNVMTSPYGPYSIAMGVNVTADHSNAIIIGSAPPNYSFVNNFDSTLMIGFNSTFPTLFVSKSPNKNSTGRIGIGNVTSPLAKLHLKADNGEPATVSTSVR